MKQTLLLAAAAALLTFATLASAGRGPANFDRASTRTGSGAEAPARGVRAVTPKRTEPARFAWAPRSGPGAGPALPLSPLADHARPEAAARSALHGAARQLELAAEAIEGAHLRELHDRGRGPVIARFQEMHEGLPVFGREVSVLMDRDLRPVAFSGRFTPSAKAAGARTLAPGFALTPERAVDAAVRDLAGASRVPGLRRIGATPRMTRVYYPDGKRLVPAYRFSVRAAQADGHGAFGYGYVVSATDGSVLVRMDQTRHEQFTYRAYADATTPFLPFDGPLGNERAPFPNANPQDNPARVPVTPPLITLQNGPISTNDPWLAANAAATRGNNVDAYTDLNSPDGIGGDSRALTTALRTFDYPSTADVDPVALNARRAAIVNLFYVNNYLHDLWYDHGFDEASGNAQTDNFNRGGIDGDVLLAEAQDFSGRNNANMFTPGDGESPVMQMFLWDGGSSTLTVDAPALGALQHALASFGATSFDLTDDVAIVNDGTGTAGDGCEAFAGVTGLIALIDRGNCDFVVKAANAQAAGAVGVVIANNLADDGAIGLGGDDPTLTLPAMSISKEDGDVLKAELGSGTVTLHMVRVAGADRDSALDNGIVAHEWFHYASNRLVGDGFGLFNNQGSSMGEGWSDVSTLILAVRPSDTGVAGNATFGGAYGTGLYVDNSAYFGIRRAPYSTDFAVNPLTFQHIQDGVPLPNTAPLLFGGSGEFNSEVHASGEIWANVLWEVYAALLNDPRYTFDQARGRMMDYVIAGLKLTPSFPTFLEARDALLAVARATDDDDHALMATAFAKRGMGVNAVGPGRDSVDHVGVVESYVALAAGFTVTDFSFDYQYEQAPDGYCDADDALDPGETALLSITVASNGTLDLAAGATIDLGTDGDVTLGTTTLVLPALAVGAETTLTVPVTLNSAGGTAETLTFTLDFPEAGGAPDAVIEPLSLDQAISVNFDLAVSRNFDDVELPAASTTDWTAFISDTAAGPTWAPLDGDADFGTGFVWHGPNAGTPAFSTLTSPSFDVAGAFSLDFDHFFELEPAFPTGGGFVYFDGGVIEVSVNGGAWQDAVAFGADFTTGDGYNGSSLAFSPARQAFVDTNGGMEAMTLDFGTLLAGDSARIRFRLQTDESIGAFGWVVDNLVFNGITAPIFSTPGAEDDVCIDHPPVANAGADFAADEGAVVNLTGTASDFEGSTLTYTWTRVSGPNVTLTNATTLTPQFTAPSVSTATALVLRLTANDGTSDGTDDITVTINNTGGGGGGGGGALGGELALAGLLALWLRRRHRAA